MCDKCIQGMNLVGSGYCLSCRNLLNLDDDRLGVLKESSSFIRPCERKNQAEPIQGRFTYRKERHWATAAMV